MATVKLSKLNPQFILNHSESIHLNNSIVTGVLWSPTSKKARIANIVVIITLKVVINCAPLAPIFLPKKPDTIDPSNGKIIILKYIIYIL